MKMMMNWMNNFDEEIIIKNKELGIGYIILYDQITRHIARAQCYPNNYIMDNITNKDEICKQFILDIANNKLPGKLVGSTFINLL